MKSFQSLVNILENNLGQNSDGYVINHAILIEKFSSSKLNAKKKDQNFVGNVNKTKKNKKKKN